MSNLTYIAASSLMNYMINHFRPWNTSRCFTSFGQLLFVIYKTLSAAGEANHTPSLIYTLDMIHSHLTSILSLLFPLFPFIFSPLRIYQHWPKPFWHPAQQYRRLEPHLPATEQHWLPGQVLLPLRLPHLPLVLTLLGADVLAGGAAEVGVGVGRTEVATVD